MKNVRILFVAQAFFIVALSVVSGFSIPDFKDANWDTVLFLTPIGILKNFTSESSALRSFYLDISSGQTNFELWQWAAVSCLYLSSAVCGFLFLRKLSSQRGGV